MELILKTETCTEDELRKALSELVDLLGSKTKAAKHLGVSSVYIGDILNGNRGISDRIARGLGGWERKTVFVRKRDSNLVYEDELPIEISDGTYSKWYESSSVVDGVRMGPKLEDIEQ